MGFRPGAHIELPNEEKLTQPTQFECVTFAFGAGARCELYEWFKVALKTLKERKAAESRERAIFSNRFPHSETRLRDTH